MGHRPPHPIRFHRHGGDHVFINLQSKFHRIHGIEEAFLVFLQIFIVGQRQALQCGQHGHQLAVYPSRFASHQFGNIRIFFLGHHGRTGCECVIQFNKAKLRTAPQAQLFRKTAHMHHQHRSEGQEIQNVIPVADRVHAVRVNRCKIQLLRHIKTVDGESGSGNGTGPQRHHIRVFPYPQQAAEVTLQHVEISQQMVGKGDGLRPLQMGIARHQGLVVFFCHCQEFPFKIQQQFPNLYQLPFHVHMHVQSHLVVAAPGRVQPCPRVPDPFRQAGFHIHMDVFQGYAEFKITGLNIFQDILEPRHDLLSVCLRNDAALYQHVGMGNAAPDIFAIQTLIIINGRIKCVH